jgi:DNA-binding transcriptional MerR regulator
VSSLPPKLYFRIGEVAGLVGVEPHVLRYWEREFRSIRPTKSSKGQRVYSRRDVENLMRVRELLYAEGFTIAGAKKKLQKNGVEPEASAAASEEAHDAKSGDAAADAAPARERAALVELRGEIEAFLAELGGGG